MSLVESQPIHPDIMPELVKQQISRPAVGLRFPKRLEAQFEKDTGPARCQQLIWRGLVGVALMDLFLILDSVSIPDAFILSAQLRLGLLTPLSLVCIFILSRNPRPFLRESIQVMMSILAAAVVMMLTFKTESPLKAHYPYGVILVMLFATAVQVTRFWYVMVTFLCILVTVFTFVFCIQGPVQQQMALVPGLIVGAALLCMASSYSLERESRLTYLNGLLHRLYFARLETMSTHDALTGLGNRRAIDQSVDFLKTGRNVSRQLSLILVDIDYFKHYNDRFGHLAGDQCLKDVADILSGQCRSQSCQVFRYGGEEFVVLLPDVNTDNAAIVAERMRAAIAGARISHCKPTEESVVTASFGVASGNTADLRNLEPLLRAADEALYEAKGAGRNQVIVSSRAAQALLKAS